MVLIIGTTNMGPLIRGNGHIQNPPLACQVLALGGMLLSVSQLSLPQALLSFAWFKHFLGVWASPPLFFQKAQGSLVYEPRNSGSLVYVL